MKKREPFGPIVIQMIKDRVSEYKENIGSGWSINFVMKQFGLSYQQLFEIIDDGHPLHIDEQKIVQDVKNGKSNFYILHQYGVTDYVLRMIKIRYKLRSKRKDSNTERDNQIVAMYKNDKSVSEIMQELNMGRQRIYQILKREGIDTKRKKK